ncbi:hypothetical protein FS749_015575 [Ceratobasidium sp. UAMH 11750]|nr:hypothetical protein FS749_015575 [Ceratobasidium sp. UAMH 11750]
MEIYPANSPPAPKTAFGPAPPSTGSSGKRTRDVHVARGPNQEAAQSGGTDQDASLRTKLLSSVAVPKKASVSPGQSTVQLPTASVDPSSCAPPLPLLTEPEVPAPKIRCVCQSTQDDRGWTIVCEGCGLRPHARCYVLDGEDEVDGRWMCGLREGEPGGWRNGEGVEAKDVAETGEKDMANDTVGTVADHGPGEGEGEGEGEGDVGKEAEVGKDQAEVGKQLMHAEAIGKERMEGKEVTVDRGMEDARQVGLEGAGPAQAGVEVEEVGSEMERAKETDTDTEKDKVVAVDLQPATVKKKGPPGKSKAPGARSKPELGGFKTNAKNAKSGTAAPSKIIAPPTKSLIPTIRMVLAPLKGTKASSLKTRPPKSTSTPEPTPSAPPSPRSGSPSIATGPDVPVKEVERAKSVEPAKVIKKAPTPPPSNPSPIATRTALPPSSPPRPPTPLAPSPPKPSA